MGCVFLFDVFRQKKDCRGGFWECTEEIKTRHISGTSSVLLQHSSAQHPRHEHAQVSQQHTLLYTNDVN